MSEFDSLSDSDWLDISSNRESDDNDSVSSQDSDREDALSVARSRRSSISLGSSREGDVEAWEGFVESGDEAFGTEPPVFSLPLAAGDHSSLPAGLTSDIDQDSDDQRVKDALDQSLIGTLTASRASSAGHSSSTHTSIRDLRLSFPDPLTSSRDELNRSYEDVSPSDTAFSTTDDDGIPAPPSGGHSSPNDVQIANNKDIEKVSKSDSKPLLDIFLYGSSSPSKWSFVQELLEKASCVSGYTIFDKAGYTNDRVQTVRRVPNELLKHDEHFTIHDYTGDIESLPVGIFDRPSLAIVYLPCPTLPILSHHSSYLPIVVPSQTFHDVDGAEDVNYHAAEDDWDLLNIPIDKVVNFGQDSKSVLFNSEDLRTTDPLLVYQVLQGIADDVPLHHSAKPTSEHTASVQAVTFFALVSLVIGIVANVFLKTSTPFPTFPTPTLPRIESHNLWELLGASPNQTSSVLPTITNHLNSALAVSSLKDLALSVFNPGTTSLSVINEPLPPSLTPTSLSRAKPCESCAPSTSAAQPRPTKDVILRPVPATPSIEMPTYRVVPMLDRTDRRSEAITTAVGLKIIDSVSVALGVAATTVMKVVANDIQELVAAVDELMRVIQKQTQSIISQSKDTAHVLGDQMQMLSKQLHARNDRAKKRASELKKKGEEFILSASEKIAGRTKIAKKKARTLTESFLKSEAWRTYEQSHRTWATKLRERSTRARKSRNRENRHHHRRESACLRGLYCRT